MTLSSGPGATKWTEQATIPDLKPGDEFAGRYRVIRLIGQGGMGTVYLAQDGNTGEEVCLKLMRPELLSQPGAVERFREEGRIARNLQHPGVVRVFDIDQRDGFWFISMEYVPGQSLRTWMNQRLQSKEPVAVEEATWIADQLLSTLEYAHGKLIHRDIKPENILLVGKPDRPDAKIKLLDFGIARTAGVANLTQTGVRLGTPAYMAPEQEVGSVVTHAVDLYSVGAVLYELLCGAPPRGRWPLPSEVNTRVDRRLDEVLKSALSSAPASRPPDAGAFRSLLREAIGTAVQAPANSQEGRNSAPRADDEQETEERNSGTSTGPAQAVRVRLAIAKYALTRSRGESVRAWLRSMDPEVEGALRPQADQGSVKAQLILGLMYYLGEGTDRDFKAAVRWFSKAAQLGDDEAQAALAECYSRGRGVDRNDSKAFKWYLKSAEQGNAEARYRLGRCYYHGRGVAQNHSKAVLWFRRAAEAGLADAQHWIGGCYLRGRGVAEDISAAKHWLSKAAKQEHEGARKELRRLDRGESRTADSDSLPLFDSREQRQACPQCGSIYSFRGGFCATCGYGGSKAKASRSKQSSIFGEENRNHQSRIGEAELLTFEQGAEADDGLDELDGLDVSTSEESKQHENHDSPGQPADAQDFSTVGIVLFIVGPVLAVFEQVLAIPYLSLAAIVALSIPLVLALVRPREHRRDGDMGCAIFLLLLYVAFLLFRWLYRLF